MTNGSFGRPRESSLRAAFGENLWLFFVSGICLVLAYFLYGSRLFAGSTRFPTWVLFLALAAIAAAGAILASVVREEGQAGKAADEERPGRPAPAVVRSGPAEPGEDPPGLAEAQGEASRDPPTRTRGTSGDMEGPRTSRRTRGAPAQVEETLAEIDALAELLTRSKATSVEVSESFETAPLRGPVAADNSPLGCGSCGSELVPGESARCPGCGTPLCDVCREGLNPPPCPSCAAPGTA